MDIIEKTAKDIKDLKIQGATNIALTSLKVLKKDWREKKYQEIKILKGKIEKLKLARSTEPLLFNSLDYLHSQVEELNGLNKLSQIIGNSIRRLEKVQEKIVNNGVKLIKNGMTIFTHCHSSTVTGILQRAKKQGKKFQVFLGETRPLYQGRITAKELVKQGIKVTMVVDSAASYIISKEDEIPINLVFLGCDAISPKEGVFNKIGSYSLALSACEAKIPVFVAGSLLKTFISQVDIEKRKVKEIWERKPWNLKIINVAFDFIPYKFITGIITEFGLVKPKEIVQLVAKNYPFIYDIDPESSSG